MLKDDYGFFVNDARTIGAYLSFKQLHIGSHCPHMDTLLYMVAIRPEAQAGTKKSLACIYKTPAVIILDVQP